MNEQHDVSADITSHQFFELNLLLTPSALKTNGHFSPVVLHPYRNAHNKITDWNKHSADLGMSKLHQQDERKSVLDQHLCDTLSRKGEVNLFIFLPIWLGVRLGTVPKTTKTLGKMTFNFLKIIYLSPNMIQPSRNIQAWKMGHRKMFQSSFTSIFTFSDIPFCWSWVPGGNYGGRNTKEKSI